MPRELPFAPQSINATRVLPTETLTSVFTGVSQQIVSDFPYWRGDILFPPMTGERARQWRNWLALLQEGADPTFWLPIDFEKMSNPHEFLTLDETNTIIDEFDITIQAQGSERQTAHDEFRVELQYPDPRPDGQTRLAMRERFAEFREKYFGVGSILQLQNQYDTGVSYARVIVDCGFDDSGTIFYVCLDRRTTFDLEDDIRFYNWQANYSNPKVRAQLIGSEVMGLSYDRDKISHPVRLQWQEALGYIRKEIRESGI